MPGLLADVNVQGHLPYLKRLIEGLGLWEIRAELDIRFVTFPDCGLDRHLNDRDLWSYCQENDRVLFTDDRNHEDEDSLEATLQDSWHPGHLPILTLANKGKFENSEIYATRVAEAVAELLFIPYAARTGRSSSNSWNSRFNRVSI
jgi:hypothetical protein